MAEYQKRQILGDQKLVVKQLPSGRLDVSIGAIPAIAEIRVRDGDGATLADVLDAFTDASPNTLNAVVSGVFPHVYDPVAGDWNRLREGAAIGQMLVDPADRWARQLGLVDLSRVLGAALTSANPVIAGIFDAAGNRMPAMDAIARPGFVDPIDRAARLLGVVYGNQAQLQQVAGTLELITQDTGLNTNPARWLHENHWEADEVTISTAGLGGEQNLGAVVPAGETRRITELLIRHEGTQETTVTLLISGGATKATVKVLANDSISVPLGNGREFDATEQPAVQSSNVEGGNTYVSASGVEA